MNCGTDIYCGYLDEQWIKGRSLFRVGLLDIERGLAINPEFRIDLSGSGRWIDVWWGDDVHIKREREREKGV